MSTIYTARNIKIAFARLLSAGRDPDDIQEVSGGDTLLGFWLSDKLAIRLQTRRGHIMRAHVLTIETDSAITLQEPLIVHPHRAA